MSHFKQFSKKNAISIPISLTILWVISLLLLLSNCAVEFQQPSAETNTQPQPPPAAEQNPETKENPANLRNVYKPELVVQTGHADRVFSVAFSPDGQFLASGSWDSTIKLWDVQTGQELRTFTGYMYQVLAVTFSPDGHFIASGGGDNTVRLWDIQTGKAVRTFTGHTNVVSAVVFSPDGQSIVSGSWDGTIKLWDVNTDKEPRTFKGHKNQVTSLAFSPDGRLLASGSVDQTIKLWDVRTGKALHTFTGHSARVSSVAFSPKGGWIASGSEDTTIKFWNVHTHKADYTLTGHSASVQVVAFSPDGKSLVSGSEDQTIKVWDVQTGKELYTLTGHTSRVNAVSFSPGGNLVASSSSDTTVKLWNIPPAEIPRTLTGFSTPITSVVFSPDGRRMASGTVAKTIKLWDIQRGKELRTATVHTYQVISASFSPDGQSIASGSDDATIKLWDLQTDEQQTIGEHPPVVWCVRFSPDGKYLASGGWDATIKLWDIQTGRELQTFTGHSQDVLSVAFSPDGQFLASGSGDNTVKLWDVQTGKALRSFKGHTAIVQTVAFSPDGRFVASGGWDATIKLWDIQTGKEVRTLTGHSDVVRSVVFHPDGQIIASGSDDKTVNLWDFQTGNVLHTLTGHSAAIESIAFSPHGKLLISGSDDRYIKLWDVEQGKELASLIAIGEIDWAIIAPNGQFDASPGAMRLMHWVAGVEPIELEQLKERYFEPELLSKLLGFNAEPLRDVPVLGTVKLYPKMEFLDDDPANPQVRLRFTNRGGGIGKVAVFLNGKEMTTDARPRGVDPNTAELEVEVDISEHPSLIPGEKNTIEIKVWNAEDYLVSRGLRRIYEAPGVRIEPPHLWAIVAGISDYQGDDLDLHFAAKDAEDMATALQVGAKRLFGEEHVHVTLLMSPSPDLFPQERETSVPTPAPSQEGNLLPTRQNLIQAFEAAKAAKSMDILVVYFAGHGVTYNGQNDDYYYLTSEARTGNLDDPGVRVQTAIAGRELTALIKQIPTLKQVLILDTCASGKIVESITEYRAISSGQIRALERMKDRTGLHILAGAAADAFSYEASRYGQGILTYSLLLGMRGAALREEEFVDISKLFSYSADQVPHLAKDIGGIQRPVVATPYGGASFDIGQLTDEDKPLIPLATVRPVVLRASFQDEENFLDRLELTKWVNNALRELSARGRQAPLIFIDAPEFPDAYLIVGRYRIQTDTVNLTIHLFRNSEKIGEFTISGEISDLEELTENIVEQIHQAM